ncbi:MAG: hypothetical protein A2042_09205 [Candidatus Schekmanbacteria bacterium GWA2_38_11]|uniref:DUF4139 domain-containing protein n=1 Tax=Candidatus Schekmanbacteria bacterium GWA2_38_11 TaxID=1817876 RepID=A0A1F7RI03_9BACT|nr:MAG: hypothetical protein A2042_09205 [Candidatus Schekmanbacteria bacterium GWA2_38_11]
MKIKCSVFCIIILLVSSAIAIGETVSKSTSDDQLTVEVTVYNNNLGLVKDTRKVELPAGEGELWFMDVASSVIPVSVRAKSLNYPEDFTVREQNYEYDLINTDKLLDKYVGKKIKIIDWNEFQDKKDVVEAILLSNNQGQVYKINNEIYLGYPGYKVLPEIPGNLIAKPTLMWLYDNKTKKDHNLEVSYLTRDISWKADYVVVLNKDDSSADISGWVTIDNKSGAAYKDARLKLIAGEVHQVSEVSEERLMKVARAEMAAPQFEEKPFFEYHIYDLQRKTTVKDNETKQISLLEATGVKTQKEFLFYGTRNYFTMRFNEREKQKQPVNVYIKYNNSKNNNLGMPFPAGIMRLYKKDDKGSLQFIGEDKIEHTPKDEEIRLKIGEAFDVTAERVQTDYKQITTRLHESEWEITLRNHKKEDITVGIVEPLFGNWRVIDSSHPYKKVDAYTIRFDVKVPKDEEVKVKYRVKIGL